MSTLAENLASVRVRIEDGLKNTDRPAGRVQLIAVSKTRPAQDIAEAFAAGQRKFGENYLQEALEKMHQLNELDIEWHFIGAIQSNKTQAIARHFHWVHCIEREKIARRLSDQRPADMPPLQVLIQVNPDNETTKSGIQEVHLGNLAHAVDSLPRIRLRGLMCIPAPHSDHQSRLASCRRAAVLYRDLTRDYPGIDTLSLGMSADLEEAVSAGSTMVRIGTDIFGPRS